MFKYFDIQNTGKVDFDQFYRSMEKTGIIMEKSVSKHTFILNDGVTRIVPRDELIIFVFIGPLRSF